MRPKSDDALKSGALTKMSLSSDIAREDTGRLAVRKGLQPGLVRCTGFSRRALLSNRQASIILDLVLSVCIFAACSGKASAQSQDARSTGFADYAMKLGEDPLLKLREMTFTRYSGKALPEMIGELSRHLEVWANYYQLGHHRTTFRKVNRYVRRRVHGHLRRRSHGPRYVTGPSLMSRGAALSGGPGRYPWEARHYHDDLLDRRAP